MTKENVSDKIRSFCVQTDTRRTGRGAPELVFLFVLFNVTCLVVTFSEPALSVMWMV